LFSGSFTIPFATSRSTSLTESGSSATDFKLGGLDVDFKSVFIDKNEIRFGAEFSLPEEITGQAVKVTLLPDNANALIIGSRGPQLGISAKIEFPDPPEFKLFGIIEVETEDLSIEYISANDELKIQGKLEVETFVKSTEVELEANFNGENFISIKDGKAEVKGSLSVEDIRLPGGWKLEEAKLTLDTVSDPALIGGSASVTFPWGKAVPPRNAGAGLGLEFTVDPLQLNGISANVTLPSPGVPIGTTGLFLTDVGGSLKNFAPSNTNPIEFEGNVGLSGGPKVLGVSLLQANLNDVKITPDNLTGSGKVTLINDAIANANVSITLDWNKGFLTASGGYSILDGAITTNTEFKAYSGFNLKFSNTASINVPNSVFLIGGKSLASGNFAFDFSNNGNFSDDFAAGWGQFSIPIPIIGTVTRTYGFKGFFDGRFEFIGARNIPETSSFEIPLDTPFVILAADWEISNSNVNVRIKKPDGTFIDEAQFAANNIAIVSDFTDDNTRAVVIANPTPGIWDIVVVDPTGLGAIDYSAISDSVAPTIEITSPATEVTSNGIVSIGFNAFDSDSTAKVNLFYDDDNTGLDGLLITDSLLENDGDGTFAWNTEGVPTGEYFIYAMIMDDENIPVFSNYSVGKIKVTESADLELDKVVFGNDPITNSNFTYQLSVTNNGTSISKDVVLQDSLPTEVTFISASTIPSQQTGSDLTFNLGDIASGATRTVDITVKSPTTALTLLNTAEVTSKTFDPFIGDNFATLSTNVNVPPTPLTDLSVTANSDSTNLKIGDRITYDFVVTNNGTANASGVVFQTNFTANAGGVQNLSANIGRVNRDVVTANLGSLASGQSRTVSVSADLTAAGTLTTTADVSGNELDPSTLNNSLILQKNVEAIALVPADLELSLTSDKTTANIDDIVTFRLTLTNKGTGAATSIKVKQVLASGLTFVSSSPQQGTYDSVSGIWDAGNIAKDNQAFVDIVTKVTSGGSLSNTAEVIAVAEPDPDSTPNNNNPNEDDQASVIVTIGTDETPGNLAPTDLVLSATTVNENVPPNTVIGTFSSTDPDTGNSFTYSLIAGTGDTDNTAFSIVGNQLQINNSPDFETKNSYSIRVKTTDQGGLGFEKVLTITVNDVNENPSNQAPTDLVLSATTVNENVPPNTVIGTFSSTDPDSGNSFTYSLIAGTGDTDNTAFSIVGNQLQINNSPDFETKNSYSIRVKTTDQGGLGFEKVLVITVNDVNETPGNLAPTALIFQNAVTELAENVDVTPEFKVADLLIEDDGLGTNNLFLTGRDRERFLIQNSALFYGNRSGG